MPEQVRGVMTVAGRVFIATIFLLSALGNKIPQFGNVVEYMRSVGMPAPSVMLAGGIVFLIVGSASIILGFKARIGASLLLVFLILATYYFHPFWKFTGDENQAQSIQFFKNLSMMGTMLFIMANGSGPWSLDSKVVARSTNTDN